MIIEKRTVKIENYKMGTVIVIRRNTICYSRNVYLIITDF